LGFLTGAAIYGLIYPQVFPAISGIANYGNTVLSQLWNLNVWLVIVLFGLMSVLLFYLIDRAGLHRREKLEVSSQRSEVK
jgi:membrane protein implicated in regulation of membrane protease activity